VGFPDAVPAGLPSALLERRPDVVAAERRVAAAFNRVHEAKAARLPAIALTGGVSTISSDLCVLKDHSNPVWSLGANLLAPIYRGGALKTQVEIRTAEQKQAIAEYAVVGLRACGEVEGALAAEIAAPTSLSVGFSLRKATARLPPDRTVMSLCTLMLVNTLRQNSAR